MTKSLVAVLQMCSTHNVNKNYKIISDLMVQIFKEAKPMMVFLPEAFAFIGNDKIKSKDIADTILSENGPLLSKYVGLARQYNVYMSLGGFPILDTNVNKTTNTHIILDNYGNIISSYNKIHLFDVDIPNGITIKESSWTIPGNEIITCNTPVGKLGLTICYDIRFPGLYTKLRQYGSQILLVPSAFSFVTGSNHWEILLRSRAIENQSYIIASAQIGRHNNKRNSWGHSMIIDPWGTIIAQTSTKEINTYCMCNIDINLVNQVRQSMPIHLHEKPNIYQTSKL